MRRWKIITETSIQSMVRLWMSSNHGRCSSLNSWPVFISQPCRALHSELWSHGISWTQLPSSGFTKTFVYLFLFLKTCFLWHPLVLDSARLSPHPSRLWVGQLRTHGTLDSDHFPSLQMVRLSSPSQHSAHIHFWLVPIARNVIQPQGVVLVFEQFWLP